MKRAFTLLDLMVLLAIVAIIAAIAVPNWTDSQQRTAVSRGKAELRMAATAVEAYAADYGRHPYDGYFVGAPGFMPVTLYNYWFLPFTLSTPVPYLSTSRIVDPFRRQSGSIPATLYQFHDIRYTNIHSTWGTAFSQYTNRTSPSMYYAAVQLDYGSYRLLSAGPDGQYGPTGFNSPGTAPPYNYPAGTVPIPYDPTNGVYSLGDIFRSQVCEAGYTNMHP